MAMTITATPAVAGSPQNDADATQRCKQKSELADIILSIKQHGGTLAEMMSVAGNDEAMRPLITKVYEEERRYSEDAQKQMAADLKQRIYSDCMNGAM
ncbi:hypothetical protein GG851_18345 [Bordetella petrii]|nr:hypothetical protein [Bordetella petrii]